MKQLLSLIMICILLVTSTPFAVAATQEFEVQSGFVITLNNEETEFTSVICNDKHYVPMRGIFEKMGAAVFYRERDAQMLALSRDGDIIRHIAGENIITVNGEQKTFEHSSIWENGELYVPIDMITVSFCPDRIWYDNQQLHIQKPLHQSSYHRIIQDILDVSKESNFYPERFQRYINFHAKMPSYSVQTVIFRTNLGLDFSFYENIATIEHPYELLVLVNKYRQLPKDFTQYNLVSMERKYTNGAQNYLLAGVANEMYAKMADAARSDGISMYVVSAYRTENYQRSLYNNKVRSGGKVYADNYSARPGHSEHQTGLAVDINSTYVSFENSAAYRWLQKHAHEYGFIMRYPKGKEWITGYAYEPWHYRYVGIDAATIIHEEGITYEEYYAKYVSVNEFR